VLLHKDSDVPVVEIRLAPAVAYGMTFPAVLRLMTSAPLVKI
jgi:hypothetical protein